MFACIVLRPAGAAHGDPAALIPFARAFSPRIELISAGAVLLDAEGLERLFGPPRKLLQTMTRRAAEAGLPVRISIAATCNAALYAARGLAADTCIPPGEEARFLSPLPLSLLPVPPEIQQTWALWGLRTFGDLATLPEKGIVERFGTQGLRLLHAARGAPDRPLVPRISSPRFEASEELDYGLELLEPLSFILARLLNEVCASLQAHGSAAGRLHLQIQLDSSETPLFERFLRPAVPISDPAVLLKLLRFDLEANPPPAPVLAVRLQAEPAPPQVIQDQLFQRPAPEPAQLEVTLARIAKLVGAGRFGSPELLDTHRRDAFILRPFQPFAGRKKQNRAAAHRKASEASPLSFRPAQMACRIFRPPLPAQVEWVVSRPAGVRARGVRGRVISCAGPWFSSGDWWTPEPWQREEWDVELASTVKAPPAGQLPEIFEKRCVARESTLLCRIYRDLHTGSWYVEAAYD